MKLLSNKFLWTVIFYLWVAALVFFTTVSFSPEMKKQNEGGFRFDYLEHFVLYAAIPVLFYLARGAFLKKLFTRPISQILLGLFFSGATEIHQIFLPNRSFNPIDLALNLTGFLAGALAIRFLYNSRLKKNEKA